MKKTIFSLLLALALLSPQQANAVAGKFSMLKEGMSMLITGTVGVLKNTGSMGVVMKSLGAGEPGLLSTHFGYDEAEMIRSVREQDFHCFNNYHLNVSWEQKILFLF